MPATTPKYKLRYPGLSDAPNVPQDIGNLAADLEDAMLQPMCQLVQQVAQTGWTSSTNTAVTFGASSEVIDTGAFHDTATNNTRITIGLKLGWWLVSGLYCPTSNNATTTARALVAKNGTPVPGGFASQSLSATTALVGVATPAVLVEATVSTDYIELFGYQAAASGTLGTAINSGFVACALSAVWQRPS